MSKYCWILDPGHGPHTPGKRSPRFKPGGWASLQPTTQFFEFQFNRNVVERIADLCEKNGIEYFITIPKEKSIADDLEQRVKAANDHKTDKVKLFVSVHSNAGPAETPNDWSTAKGVEVWHYFGSNLGKKISNVFLNHILKNTGLANRGLKFYEGKKQFFVLRKTQMVAILTETGFYNNKKDVQYLITPEAQEAVAMAHFEAICELEQKGIYVKI